MDDIIIGLSGKKRSGKDAVANFLAKRGYRKIAFADELRRLLLSLNPLVPWGCGYSRLRNVVGAKGWETFKREQPEEYRNLMTGLGTHGINVTDPGYFTRRVMDSFVRRGGSWVVTDVRFPTEASAISNYGGTLWRIHRPLTDPQAGDHESETGLDEWKFDLHIHNDGDLYDLEEQVAIEEARLRALKVPF